MCYAINTHLSTRCCLRRYVLVFESVLAAHVWILVASTVLGTSLSLLSISSVEIPSSAGPGELSGAGGVRMTGHSCGGQMHLSRVEAVHLVVLRVEVARVLALSDWPRAALSLEQIQTVRSVPLLVGGLTAPSALSLLPVVLPGVLGVGRVAGIVVATRSVIMVVEGSAPLVVLPLILLQLLTGPCEADWVPLALSVGQVLSVLSRSQDVRRGVSDVIRGRQTLSAHLVVRIVLHVLGTAEDVQMIRGGSGGENRVLTLGPLVLELALAGAHVVRMRDGGDF